ncbi:MAG TPA: peptidoglycan-binding domain-containing protein [Blastocatellia bacterium]|nr:peptidoglycan-binding domain-containing protein [Blastocatellia bacterium]
MHRKWICIFSVAVLMLLISADVALAKKSRPGHAASRGHARKEVRASRTSRGSRTKTARLSRRESSRQEKRQAKRQEKNDRGKIAKAGKRSKYITSSRRGRHRGYVAEARSAEPAPSRPSSGGIPSERATEIQKALIKAGYLDGPPSGQYDDATIQAMKQYQSANGLPQTGLPSALLLKRLGVPKRSNDGYAVPVNAVSEAEKKRPTQ